MKVEEIGTIRELSELRKKKDIPIVAQWCEGESHWEGRRITEDELAAIEKLVNLIDFDHDLEFLEPVKLEIRRTSFVEYTENYINYEVNCESEKKHIVILEFIEEQKEPEYQELAKKVCKLLYPKEFEYAFSKTLKEHYDDIED